MKLQKSDMAPDMGDELTCILGLDMCELICF